LERVLRHSLYNQLGSLGITPLFGFVLLNVYISATWPVGDAAAWRAGSSLCGKKNREIAGVFSCDYADAAICGLRARIEYDHGH
jgi:hypothetical protein